MADEMDSHDNETSKENNGIAIPTTLETVSSRTIRKQRLASVFQELTNHYENQRNISPGTSNGTFQPPSLSQPSCVTQASRGTSSRTTKKQSARKTTELDSTTSNNRGSWLLYLALFVMISGKSKK